VSNQKPAYTRDTFNLGDNYKLYIAENQVQKGGKKNPISFSFESIFVEK